MISPQEINGKQSPYTESKGERWSERVAVPEWLLHISILK